MVRAVYGAEAAKSGELAPLPYCEPLRSVRNDSLQPF
jgi:hypothetical protein